MFTCVGARVGIRVCVCARVFERESARARDRESMCVCECDWGVEERRGGGVSRV